jgi:hypothetical protein
MGAVEFTEVDSAPGVSPQRHCSGERIWRAPLTSNLQINMNFIVNATSAMVLPKY